MLPQNFEFTIFFIIWKDFLHKKKNTCPIGQVPSNIHSSEFFFLLVPDKRTSVNVEPWLYTITCHDVTMQSSFLLWGHTYEMRLGFYQKFYHVPTCKSIFYIPLMYPPPLEVHWYPKSFWNPHPYMPHKGDYEISCWQDLSDKAHSRSLCKGQGYSTYSNYTLEVKQSFIIIVHIILNLKVHCSSVMQCRGASISSTNNSCLLFCLIINCWITYNIKLYIVHI
jgi:hypothetical protein